MNKLLTTAAVLLTVAGNALEQSEDWGNLSSYGSGSYRDDDGGMVYYNVDYRPTWGDFWAGVWSAYSGNVNDGNSRAGNGGNYGVGGSGRAR